MGDEKQVVPNSAGTSAPRHKAPANAADCHMHIYDSRFPQLPSRSPVTRAAVPEYRLLQKRIGTTRVVIVQPRNHMTDNQVTDDAIRSEEHTSELQSQFHLVCRLLLEKKKKTANALSSNSPMPN